jgi:hypothetical protein
VDGHRAALRSTSFLDDLLFSQVQSRAAGIATVAVLAILFAVGVVHWVLFFDGGTPSFRGGGWPNEHSYYSVLQQAVRTWTVPYHIEPAIQGTGRFLATHETVASPQLLLLRYTSIGSFVLVNTLLMFAVGFLGCLAIRRRYALSLFSFSVLCLLFLFNGHITSHLAAGHSMWNGYFLLPFYACCVLTLFDASGCGARADDRIPLKLALVLFAMNLQGSFRMYVWSVLFLALVAAFNRTHRRPLAVAIVFSALLSCFPAVPDVMFYLNGRHQFLTGYPTIGVLVQAFVTIRPVDADFAPALFYEVGWWEYDIFTGTIGLATVIFLGVCLRWRSAKELEGTEYRELDWPMAVMAVFSMGAFYAPFASLTLSFLNSEGTPSRFLITPFLFLLIISCIRLDRLLARARRRATSLTPVRWLLLAGLVQTAFELATHSKVWAVRRWDDFSPALEAVEFTIVHRADPLYEFAVQASMAVSALTLAVWTWRYVACLRAGRA